MTKILAISDLHGDFSLVPELLERVSPDLLVCCGDWGDPDEVTAADFNRVISRVRTLTVYGNHDDLGLLSQLRNADGSSILLPNGCVVDFDGIKIAGISGIWAKSHAKPWYITDEEVRDAAKAAAEGGVDVLVTHGCAVGLNDVISGKRRGGQRCFLEAFQISLPRVCLCGHLHSQQIRQMKDGRYTLNVGQTSRGEYAVIEHGQGKWQVSVEKYTVS